MKRINSRQKGARVEREAAKFLTSLGFVATRNARNGLSAADLDLSACPVLVNVHLEIKGDRSIGLGTKALDDAMEQAQEAAVDKSWVPPLAEVGSHPEIAKPHAVLWLEHRKGWRLTWNATYPIQVTTAKPNQIKAALIQLATVGDLTPALKASKGVVS